MYWVTRSHVHVDRVACPWLITRFIDNKAEFLFVPAAEIEKVVKETGAIPFDAPGVELGHVSEDIDKDPIARGLEAIASGFSLRFPDDEENLAAQFELYDALYAWCRLDVARG
jgi:hypothetical protein